MKEDTIAAIATPPGQGAIAVIRLSGPDAFSILGMVFRGSDAKPRVQTLGTIVARDGGPIDEVLVTRFPGPRSYTAEDVVEISCHGGRLVTRTILHRLLEVGARVAGAGEFTQRAFLNGKLDLTQAEAVMEVISARSDLALRCAQRQLEGRLGERIEGWRQGLIGVIAHVEAYIDFPDEDISPETGAALGNRIRTLLGDIERLRATAPQGRILREGVATVLCGAPNVGKSSLLNRLLGFDRAIVSERAGTTRDTIEEGIVLDGIPLRLIDTAGLRETGEAVEREGMARTERSIRDAELILEVFDGHAAPPAGSGVVPPEGAVHLRVLNKADLGLHPEWSAAPAPFLPVSCLTGGGVDDLKAAILAALPGNGDGDLSVTASARHLVALTTARDHLEEALARLGENAPPELAAADLRSTLHALAEITGKTDIEEILDVVFGTFCIGK